jgi:hypothetical protein
LKFSTKKHLKKLKMPPPGARGGLQILLRVNISSFYENKPPMKFQKTNLPPSNIFKKYIKIAPRGWGSEFYFFPRIFDFQYLRTHAKI